MNWSHLDGRRVLVTGATGFVGGRLVERLALETGARIRVAVRTLSRLPRIARFDVEVAECDVLDRDQVYSAVRGSEIVFHCAYGNRGNPITQGRVTVEGTKNVLEAARILDVERVVHFSTFAVYGPSSGGNLTEISPRRKSGHAYADHKLEAEREASRHASSDLGISILQPTVVYGPFGSTWTSDILQRLSTGRAILIDGGRGICNAVYVDDVVSAAFLAAMRVEAVGETFLISGGENVTWSDFYGRFEDMLGRTATVSMSKEEALRYWRKSSRRSSLLSQLPKLALSSDVLPELLHTKEGNFALQLSRRVLPPKLRTAILMRSSPTRSPSDSRDRYIHPLNPHAIRFLASSRHVAIDKASNLLGYTPAFSLDRGMHLTRLWAEWAELLPTNVARHTGEIAPAMTREEGA